MEEAEQLSTRIGIMVKGGKFSCIGSSQQIKNKYGKYYEVELEFLTEEEDEGGSTSQSLKQVEERLGADAIDNLLTKEECIELLRKDKETLLESEIENSGVLAASLNFNRTDGKQQAVSKQSLIAWIHLQSSMLKLADILLKHGFPSVELIEHQD